jgi:hypothetical protein
MELLNGNRYALFEVHKEPHWEQAGNRDAARL